MSLEITKMVIKSNVTNFIMENDPPINHECPLTLDDLIRCIIMESIYHAYIRDLKAISLQENYKSYPYIYDKNDQDAVKNLYRWHKKLQDYRRIEAEYNKEMHKLSIPNDYQAPLSNGRDRRKGLELTPLQFGVVYTTYSCQILESLTHRKLINSNNYSQERFIREMNQLDELKDQLIHSINNRQDVLFNTFMLYELEWLCPIEFLYAVASEAKNHPTSPLNVEKIPMLTSRVTINLPDEPIIRTESRFLIGRMKMIPALFDCEKWDIFQDTIMYYLIIKKLIQRIPILTDNGPSDSLSTYFQEQTTREEWEEFCLTEYNMGSIHSKKQWTREHIATFRRIWDSASREKGFFKAKKTPNKASDNNSAI